MNSLVRLVVVTLFGIFWGAPSWAADPLVSVDWIVQNRGKPGVVIVDVRSSAAYRLAHIPGAISAPYEWPNWRAQIAGHSTGLPSPTDFAALASHLGIRQSDHVVIVDMGRATQIYWTFRVMGHREISLLNGGMRVYNDRLMPTETTLRVPAKGGYVMVPRGNLLATAEQVRNSIGRALFIDARPAGQFLGITKISAVRRLGTIPGAVNFPANWLVRDLSGLFRPVDVIGKLFAFAKVPTDRETIIVSDRGIQGSLLWFALHELLGNKKVSNYNGGFIDWTQDESNPIEQRFVAN